MTKYTAEDFARAHFARHEDGGLAVRMDPGGTDAWCAQLGNAWAWYTDAELAATPGWSIVRDADTMTAREHLNAAWEKAHVVDVIPAGVGSIVRYADGSYYGEPDDIGAGVPAKGGGFERRLLDPPPAPARPEWVGNAGVVWASALGHRHVLWWTDDDGAHWEHDGQSVDWFALSDVTPLYPEGVRATRRD